ncbi:MAG: hypothetical protein KC964_17190, partial [Candidatus Omnitrophica bacterium]|nr:hypothetical protein [Candidatus Omnitrophota bacterium]
QADWIREEMRIRNDEVNVVFRMLRAGTAAKLKYILTGQPPSSASQFSPLLKEGLPVDVFSGDPLKFSQEENGNFVVYSVGPDEKDDRAAIQYHPTNGTLSRGDLNLEFQSERKYPFSSEGLSANSATDVLQVFNRGLPLDPFAGNGSIGLSVYDATRETPVRIFSFGPEGDILRYYSNVEVFRRPEFYPVDIESPTDSRNLSDTQWVFHHPSGDAAIHPATRTVREIDMSNPYNIDFENLRTIQKEVPIQPFTLGPRYSPTNGIKSDGQIWIDSPKKNEAPNPIEPLE